MPVKCMDFLTRKRRGQSPSVMVVFGDEDFLRRQAHLEVRKWVVGPDPDEFTYATFPGDETALRDVLDELFTPPFLGDRRLVVVENAEKFVSKHREALLSYVSSPSECGVLLLEPSSFSSSTKLAKAVEKSGLSIEAKAPKPWHVPGWCCKWAEFRHHKTLTKPDAEWLSELVGTSLGMLDQELEKLATFVGEKPRIDWDAINRLVAGTRTESTFKLLDMALDGQLPRSLELLDRQLVAGDSPVMILAMLTSQLRKLTQAARCMALGGATDDALLEAGIPAFAIEKSQSQLRRLGQARMAGMYRRLLEADYRLKGGSNLQSRTLIERFLIELATK